MASLGILMLATCAVLYLWCKVGTGLLIFGMLAVLMVAYQWWRDVVRESTFQGEHTSKVCSGLYLGIVLFIVSEVMFFFSFFFGFFFVCLSPDVSLGCSWPPMGIQPLSYLSVPLFNTLLLLSSGVSITWAHHGLLSSNMEQTVYGLFSTVGLGISFVSVQLMEYFETPFSLADSVYGSFFFLMTGFHGLHVLVGLIFIIINVMRALGAHFSIEHSLGFEMGAWYWHFVDVILQWGRLHAFDSFSPRPGPRVAVLLFLFQFFPSPSLCFPLAFAVALLVLFVLIMHCSSYKFCFSWSKGVLGYVHVLLLLSVYLRFRSTCSLFCYCSWFFLIELFVHSRFSC